mmetsp:Transcript_33749/g.47098  ORF Transcript_33749/g.47098 Transcript_33749/m.47098 type:complete len:224 (-) Transcript_33749:28-699(-)
MRQRSVAGKPTEPARCGDITMFSRPPKSNFADTGVLHRLLASAGYLYQQSTPAPSKWLLRSALKKASSLRTCPRPTLTMIEPGGSKVISFSPMRPSVSGVSGRQMNSIWTMGSKSRNCDGWRRPTSPGSGSLTSPAAAVFRVASTRIFIAANTRATLRPTSPKPNTSAPWPSKLSCIMGSGSPSDGSPRGLQSPFRSFWSAGSSCFAAAMPRAMAISAVVDEL